MPSAILRFMEAEDYQATGEFVEVETGKGADALDRPSAVGRRVGASAQGEVPGAGRQARSAVT
jgi:hypothetical protein